MDGALTPTNQFFVRNHFPIPAIDASHWKLSVSGEVDHPISFTYRELKSLPAGNLTCLLECAGNSRAAVQPPVEGLLWDHGGVSNARWGGVPVHALLERAGLRSGAQEVLFEGADGGKERGADTVTHYAMSLPMDRAMHPDTLLAYEMNGHPLTAEHGFPLRLVTPGWYGMTSVKWLTSIRVIDFAFEGFHQSHYYVFQEAGPANGTAAKRVTGMRVKSLITAPGRGEALPAGVNTIRGVAWSGTGPVLQVEVSVDSGQTWRQARVQASPSSYSWQQWEYRWEVDHPGYYLLRARATDAEGNTQPEQAPWNFRGFANNSIHVVPVQVRSTDWPAAPPRIDPAPAGELDARKEIHFDLGDSG
jgi:DMSO/TMAO reductase YedYZ molybdopterin-dependent catalytic subunit